MELSTNVTKLEDGEKTIYLLGTAHISRKSVEEVIQVLEQVQPETVCVELCETRYRSLTDENVWKKLNIFEVIKQGKTLFLLAHLALGMYQRRMGEQFGVKPGEELMTAVHKAKELNSELVLVDREVQVTLKRTWNNLGMMQKLTMLGSLLLGTFSTEKLSSEDLEKLKEKKELEGMLEALSREFPQVKESLIDERDKFLISKIEEAPGKTIVAVVGAGHVKGMTENFKKKIDRDVLNQLPEPSKTTAMLKWIIPLVVFALFAVGFMRQADKNAMDLVWAWVLPNSIACALMAAIAGAKFYTIVAGFIASPITSLNPAIGAGMVTGLVEAWLRKPTVEDCERINQDIKQLRDLYSNNFTRVLLVAVLSNMGSAMGAWIGLGWLLKLVF